MPELPEVECFRRMLLPLVSHTESLHLELVSDNPSRKFISPEQVEAINKASLCVKEIKRRGKQLCLCLGKPQQRPSQFLFLHMGMTGLITTPSKSAQFGHFSNATTEKGKAEGEIAQYPPAYTYLTFRAGNAHASFSDPRKFGSTYLADNDTELEQLAPDALEEEFDLNLLCGSSLGIKALLLDQKRVVSGVGNWVADEILYQTEIHPLQTHLTQSQASAIQKSLPILLQTAVECLERSTNYPEHWLFHFRWTKGKNTDTKDAMGRSLQFLTAGGRTSAIVPSVQKLRKSQKYQESATKAHISEQKQKVEKRNTVEMKRKVSPKQDVCEVAQVRKRIETEDNYSGARRRSPRLAITATN